MRSQLVEDLVELEDGEDVLDEDARLHDADRQPQLDMMTVSVTRPVTADRELGGHCFLVF